MKHGVLYYDVIYGGISDYVQVETHFVSLVTLLLHDFSLCYTTCLPVCAVCNASGCIIKLMVACRTLSADTDDNERPKDTWGPGGR